MEKRDFQCNFPIKKDESGKTGVKLRKNSRKYQKITEDIFFFKKVNDYIFSST